MMKKGLYTLLCIVAFLLPVIAYAQPVANFSANVVSGCSPILVQFSDQSTGTPASWQWDLGNGTTSNLQNPSTTYITAGTYTVVLTVSNSGGSNTKTVTNYITVYPTPVVGFSADSTPSCPPKNIVFTNTTVAGAGGTTTYTWDFGDGQTSGLQNPSHTYTTAANYSVTLLVTNSAGCSNTLTKNNYIPLTAAPTAAFTATNTTSCTVPLTTTFTNTSTGGTSYSWDFGDGQTSTQTSPSHTYNTAGVYTVKLIATSTGGCADTITKTAFVNAGGLKASFNVSDSTVCINDNILFSNTSSPAPFTTTWNFGDGNFSSNINHTYGYAAAGTYTVTLTVSANGCVDSAKKNITIYPSPHGQFTASNTLGCTTPFSTTFSNTSTNAASYLWIFGDGTTSTQTNPTKTYNTAGTYTVKLVSYSAGGCIDTATQANYITIQPMTSNLFSVPDINPSIGCAPFTTTMSASSTSALPISTYSWSFGDGNTLSCNCPNPTHTYTLSGNYNLSVTYNTVVPGCSFTQQKLIKLGAKPTASFPSLPDTICPKNSVSFTNNSTGATNYVWWFGDGDSSIVNAPSHVYDHSGSYNVMLVAFNGICPDSLTVQHKVFVKLPFAKFYPSFGCSNRKLFTFADSSLGANTYSWNFGDGSPVSTQSGTVTHLYAAYGTYTVTLTVTNASTGCSDTYVKQVRAYPITTQFSVNDSTICKGQTAAFTGTPDNDYVNYAWNFGNGVNVAYPKDTASVTYANAGIYDVKLVVTDKNGCKDSLVKTGYMHVGGPVASFTGAPLSGCTPLSTTFTDASSSTVYAISSRQWNFGDGNTLTTGSTSFVHSYTAGTFNVTLKITDANGCKDSMVKPGYVVSSHATSNFFSADTNACVGQTVNFINSSNSASSLWFFGDGNTSSAYSVGHAYAAPGTYTVKLVTYLNGCTDTMVKNNYVHVNALSVALNMSDSFATCPPLTVHFSSPTALSSYQWTFGNNSQSTLATPSTVYTYPGTYTVKLIGQNANGCVDSATKTVHILGPTGTLSYTPLGGCKPFTVSFSSTNNNTAALIWDMSNGFTQTTTASTYTYTYTTAGKFVPKLILSDGASCLVPIIGMDTIKVDSMKTNFSFSAGTICQSGTVQFTDTVLYSLSGVSTRNWTFGDGGFSTAHNPSHTYAAPGTYQVKLVTGNNAGCTDTVVKTVVIHTPPTVSGGGNAAICQGQTTSVQLQATGATTYSWSPSTGLSCTGCANPQANPTTTTTYSVIGTDSVGCKDTATVTVTVNAPPAVSAGANQNICSGGSATLQATGAVTYSWSPSTGLSCVNCANPTATPTTTTTYTVTGTNANGCTDTGVVTVTVNPLPNVTAGPAQAICAGGSAQLQANGGTSYSWSPSTGLSCTGCANPIATPATTTTYTVTGTNANGCTDTGVVTVTVNPQPNVNGGGNKIICAGGSISLNATGAVNYSWSPATGLSCTSCANPTASPTTSTTYTVVGINGNGCTDTDQVTITVVPLPNVSAGANQSICIGGSVNLQATGATSYSWTPSTGLSCTGCANPTANPATTTTYTVTGTNASGCTNTATVTVTVNPLPTISAGSNQTICAGNSAQLQATGGTSYTWTPSTGLSCTSCANPLASPATTTTYTVTGTNSNGCSNTSTVTVTVNPQPTVSGGGNKTICAGGSVTLQATGASTYTWSPSTGLSCTNCASPTATPSTTTTYTVIGTNANGCTDTDVVTVTVNPLPNVSAGANQNICIGGSVGLQATGATSYTWSPSTGLSCTSCANPVANPTTTTTYTVTGTNSNGCVNTSTVTVTVNPLPNVTASANQSICIGGSASLQATGGVAYTWAPATGLSCTSCANPTATPTTTTTYTVTGTNNSGCTDTGIVTVTVNPLPNVNAGADQSICAGSSIILQATGAATYVWSPSTGLSCTNCASPSASPSATTTYVVTGTSSSGCVKTDTVTITVNPIPVVNATVANNIICDGTSTTMQATGATSYSWLPTSGLSCTNCANPTATPSATTTYVVLGTTNGCTDTAQVTISVVPKPNIIATNGEACEGGSVNLHASGGLQYQWTPATGLSCTTCPDPVANPLATTTYSLTGTDGNGCSNTIPVIVTIHPTPDVNAGADQNLCKGGSVQLNATGAANYTWSPADNLSCTNCANPTANPTTPKDYKVVGVDTYGCSDSDIVHINIIEKLPVRISPNVDICEGNSATLSASGGTAYQWVPASGLNSDNISNPVASPSVTTTYRVIIKQGDCFADTPAVTVTVHNNPTVDLGPDMDVIAGSTVQLNAKGTDIAKYVWSPTEGMSCTDCADPKVIVTHSGTYSVTVSSEWGCTSKDDINLHITCDGRQVFVANTFTPNGDGVNDRFYPQGKGVTSVKMFAVYNRWGQLVYQANDISLNDANYGWDGTFQGEPAKPDVFVYMIHATCESGDPIELKGDISLIR